MAPKKKNTKDTEDSKKGKGKKTVPEDGIDAQEAKEESSLAAPSNNEITNQSTSELSKQEPTPIQEEVPNTKYEEPVLTSIIVESYEGEKDKGLFQGYGKIVYRGDHTYEGDFNQGMMSGKGKYVWANGISYEGDFLNNEIAGTGTYRWPSGDSNPTHATTYTGEVFKGKRHGTGIFKSGTTPVIYEGEWNMGRRYGKGKMIYDADGQSYYEGDWVNNKKFGWGIRHYPSGNIYEGMWVDDIRHGEGTMRWFDKNQTYTGQWENGIQNGLGEHNWYLARVEMTQYALRNTFYGNFKNGKRHGQGTFLYANGAKYEGSWENNLKHGWGKYTFKDGRKYEGYFEDDKMTENPTYNRTSILSHEISKIKTRIPSAGTTLNIHMLRANHETNRSDYLLVLEINSILQDFLDIDQRNQESVQAHKTVIRYLDLFKQVYRFYSQLGFDSSPDNTYVLNRMQFWRFLKDCRVNLKENCITLMDFDRLLNPKMKTIDLHCPYDKILIREFFNYIVLTAYHLYKDDFDGNDLKISWCIEKLIVDNILPYSCNVQGYFYSDARKTLNVLTYMVKSYDIYRFLCSKRIKEPYDSSITMRNFLIILNDYKLIDGKLLSTKDVIEILSSDNTIVYDSENSYNLELEMTFLEFFEALIGCAIKLYDNNLNNNTNMTNITINNNQETTKLENQRKLETLSQLDYNRTNSQSELISPNASAKPTSQTKSIVLSNPASKLEKENSQIPENKVESSEQMSKSLDVDNGPGTNRPGTATDININIMEEKENLADKDLKYWIERNNFFFNTKFFPAAEKYLLVTQMMNRSI